MSANWPEYLLQDLCDFQNGFAFKNSDYISGGENTWVVFRMGYISRGGGFKEDSTPVFVPKEYTKKLDRYLLCKGDLTIAMTDMKNSMALLGHTARVPEDERFVLNQRVGLIRVRKTETLDPLYFYYFSNSPDYIAYLRSRANSGVQVNLSTSAIKESVIKVPPLSVQKSIGEILGSLDGKIQLNHQINQTLEQMAQAIFKSWFVDFEPVKAKIAALEAGGSEEDALLAAMQVISGKPADELSRLQAERPEQYAELRATTELFPSAMQESELGEIPKGWGCTSLGNLCATVTKGTTPKKTDIIEAVDDAVVPFIKVKDITDTGEIFCEGIELIPDSISRKQLKRSILKNGDLLFSIAGTIGRVAILDATLEDSNTNQAVGIIRLREKEKHLPFVWQALLSKRTQNEIKSKVVQGVQANASLKNLRDIQLVHPRDELLYAASSRLSTLLKKIASNRAQSRRLVELRSSLLPQLLSGELSVSAAEDRLEKAEVAADV